MSNYNRKYENETEREERDYKTEAQNLIRPLNVAELYELYEIVGNLCKKSRSDDRDNELSAVRNAIEVSPLVSRPRLARINKGYGSMAADARPKDGQTDTHRKQV